MTVTIIVRRGLNGRRITSTAQLRAALKAPSQVWRISIERGGKLLTTVVAG